LHVRDAVHPDRLTTRAGLAGPAGSGVSAAEAVTEADAAMALLHRAVAMGYCSPGAFRTEEALDPLRSRDDFKLLMMDLAMPAEPVALGLVKLEW
jgi:hypothetical protein